MKFLVLGAGATGGFFGGKLAHAGGDVAFLVRSKRKDQLDRGGLKISSADGELTTPVKAIVREELSGPYDVVLLTAKAYDLADAIETIRPAVGPRSQVLPVLNGMRHLDDLDAAFGKERVLGGTCHISASLDHDGTIRQLSPFASITQGAREASQQAASEEIHRQFERGGFEARHAEDVIAAMWEKWVLLATLAGSTCLMRASIGEIVATNAGAGFISAMIDECDRVAQAMGYPTRSSVLAATRGILTDPTSAMSGSMRRDMEAGRRVEADHIVGGLAARGRSANVATPLLDVAYAHLQAYQNRLATA